MTHRYLTQNGKVMRETIGTGSTAKVLDFIYDNQGRPLALKYSTNGGSSFNTYYYVLNYQGDVVKLIHYIPGFEYSEVASYTYDAWGNVLSSSGALASVNPLRYRGYYYDTETGLYYVSSRYYDPAVCRFLNADSVMAGVGGSVKGYNLFAYCFNNPVNMSDNSGHWPQWIEDAANWVNNNIVQPIKEFFSTSKQSNIVTASSHDANRRPYRGEPGSTYTAPNGDSRTYGPDGTPEHDYDHDDHGRPDKHPHDPNGGHNHDWENGGRGPAYSMSWEPIVGVGLVTVCAIGYIVIAVDDATGIGIADDFLFGPLSVGVGKGFIMIFGS